MDRVRQSCIFSALHESRKGRQHKWNKWNTRNPSCRKDWTTSCKENLIHAVSQSEVKSTILSGIPALWHHQLLKPQWVERTENSGNLMTPLSRTSSCHFSSLEDIEGSHPFKRRMLPSYSCPRFLFSPLRARMYGYSCLMSYWNKLPSRGAAVES